MNSIIKVTYIIIIIHSVETSYIFKRNNNQSTICTVNRHYMFYRRVKGRTIKNCILNNSKLWEQSPLKHYRCSIPFIVLCILLYILFRIQRDLQSKNKQESKGPCKQILCAYTSLLASPQYVHITMIYHT